MILTKERFEKLQMENPFMSLGDILYKVLLQEIATFQLPPKASISENNLAQLLQISRSPIKAALEKLKEKGFVIKKRGYTVTNFSKKEYIDIMNLARLLEPYAAGLAATRITTQELQNLYDIAYRMRDLYNEAAASKNNMNCDVLIDLEYQFHVNVVVYAKNPMLAKMYEELRYKAMHYRCYLIYDPPEENYYQKMGEDHCLICDAIRSGDKDVAAAMMRHNINASPKVFNRLEKFKSILK